MSTAIATHDLVAQGDDLPARVEYVATDVQLVSAYGDRWQVPAEHFQLITPAARGGSPATWSISPAWSQ